MPLVEVAGNGGADVFKQELALAKLRGKNDGLVVC